MYDVFISYSHVDRPWVTNTLLTALETRGYNVCIDYRNFSIGNIIVEEIEKCIASSRRTICVLSPSYFNSDWTLFERALVRTLDPANRTRRLIPILRTTTELPASIKMLAYVDLRHDDDFQMNRLICSID